VSALDPAHLAVCVDFRSPHAWLAVEPTRALEARLGAAFDWLPLAVPPLVRPTPDRDGDDRGTRHRRFRARYFENDLRRYAEARGLELGDVYRAPDTALAALALLYVRAKAPRLGGAFAERVFELVWKLGADVREPPVVFEDSVLFASHEAVLYALNRANGHLNWRAALPGRPLSGPLVYDKIVLVACFENQVVGFDARTGRPLGILRTVAPLRTAPILVGDKLFAVQRDHGDQRRRASPSGHRRFEVDAFPWRNERT
jgi:2-hydroxychromene-2-carboxylate isomerase